MLIKNFKRIIWKLRKITCKCIKATTHHHIWYIIFSQKRQIPLDLTVSRLICLIGKCPLQTSIGKRENRVPYIYTLIRNESKIVHACLKFKDHVQYYILYYYTNNNGKSQEFSIKEAC